MYWLILTIKNAKKTTKDRNKISNWKKKQKTKKNKNQKENQLTLGMIYDLALEAILRQYMK
jgi:hypothetical protein